ncbi:Cysteine synthase B [Pseudolycoriella hygida]|uniref:Cysteine synthase B n=1 Tax=Pseudolycoriella hygida TaxID=35572 RepID=A0A9Q0MQA2_9DIPT|nr:Cysteine synthase B [Pseudolycoriella hygida]
MSGTTDIASSALDLIGNTPLLALDRIWPGPGRILAKCEFLNPGGSIKDRSSLGMIKSAIESGELKPNGPVLEVTSGNQGCGLAMVAAVLQHPLTTVMSKGNSPQRATMMRALGANAVLVDQVEGKPGNVTLKDVTAAENHGLDLVRTTGAYFVNQFHNDNNCLSHEKTTGPEIWKQTGGRVDAFLATVGTAGTFMGVSRHLKSKNPAIKCYAVEPKGVEPISGKPITKPLHLLQGSGYGSVPDLFKFDVLDGTLSVSDKESVEYKKLLGTKEGLYLGYTSGANVAAAVKLLQSGQLPPDAWVVTVLNDTGLKYPEIEDYGFTEDD